MPGTWPTSATSRSSRPSICPSIDPQSTPSFTSSPPSPPTRSTRSSPSSIFSPAISSKQQPEKPLIRVKYGIPLAIDVSPANVHDTKGIIPVLRELSGKGFRGSALGDLGYRGKRRARAGRSPGITVEPVARGRDGKFLPAGICWVVERSFSWISNHRRLNTIFERTKEHLVAFIEIAFVSILSRRIKPHH